MMVHVIGMARDNAEFLLLSGKPLPKGEMLDPFQLVGFGYLEDGKMQDFLGPFRFGNVADTEDFIRVIPNGAQEAADAYFAKEGELAGKIEDETLWPKDSPLPEWTPKNAQRKATA